MAERKLYPSVRKVELAGLSEGWDEECFAYVVPSTYEDQRKLTETDLLSLSTSEQLEYQLNFTREHFVSGKIKAFNGTDFELIDMKADHVDASVEVADYIYSEIMGLGLDPKDIRKVAQESALRGAGSTPTATSSSTDGALMSTNKRS